VLAFPGVSRVFPADAALGLSPRIIGEKNTAVNRIFGRCPPGKWYILTNNDPETIHVLGTDLSASWILRFGRDCVAQRGKPQVRI
jgi:hypothetical protein